LDGKHVRINAPDEGSEYYSYKGFSSIVLMAVADYKYCFSYFEVGKKGSESDGRVFQNCSLLELLENGMLPTGSFLVGDDALPLKPVPDNVHHLHVQQPSTCAKPEVASAVLGS
jgi:hypothetical protein